MIDIFDAVMGTGKSSAAFKRLNETGGGASVPVVDALNKLGTAGKYIILVLYQEEVTRYKEELTLGMRGNRSDVVALEDNGSSETMTDRFIKAVKANKTVITTHALFSLLSEENFNELHNLREYKLLIDETIVLVDKHFIKSVDIQTLLDQKYIELVPDKKIGGLALYRITGIGKEYQSQKGALMQILGSISGKHVYKVDNRNVVFVVPPEKLTIFENIFILTYLFSGSEPNGWLALFGIAYQHHELYQDTSGDYKLKNHSGTYSGSNFRALLTIHYPTSRAKDINKIGSKNPRSTSGEPLTSSWFQTKGNRLKDIEQLRKNTITFFRNMKAPKEDMLWTCFQDQKDILRDSSFHVKDEEAGLETFLAFNVRAKNEYRDRHTLAYLVNVFPDGTITKFFQKHRVPFSQETYALSAVLQWIWRSAIRDDEAVTVYIPSKRMRGFVESWLDGSFRR